MVVANWLVEEQWHDCYGSDVDFIQEKERGTIEEIIIIIIIIITKK